MEPDFLFIDPGARIWMAFSTILIFFMQAGFAMLEIGFTRSKNSTNVMMKNFIAFCFGLPLYLFLGFGLMFGESTGGIIGTSLILVDFQGASPDFGLFALFQAMFCVTCTSIISGALAERLQLKAFILVAIVTCGFVYPLFGHWTWNLSATATAAFNQGLELSDEMAVGWLGRLGFIDFAGGSVVHIVGGGLAVSGAWVLGPRMGKYSSRGTPFLIRGHNLSLASLGTFILWFGWFGFNGGSLWPMKPHFSHILLVTSMGGAAGFIAALVRNLVLSEKVNPEHALTGVLAGLVAITPGAHILSLPAAFFSGLVGSLLSIWALDFLEKKTRIDDPVGAGAVHLFAGIWGTVSIGFLSSHHGLFNPTVIGVQFLGAGVAVAWGMGTGLGLFTLLKWFGVLRVSKLDEIHGLNQSEHDYPAYDETGGHIPLGQILLAETSLDPKDLHSSLKIQKDHGVSIKLGEILVNQGLVTRQEIKRCLEFQGVASLHGGQLIRQGEG